MEARIASPRGFVLCLRSRRTAVALLRAQVGSSYRRDPLEVGFHGPHGVLGAGIEYDDQPPRTTSPGTAQHTLPSTVAPGSSGWNHGNSSGTGPHRPRPPGSHRPKDEPSDPS